MLEKIKEYFEKEYEGTVKYLENNHPYFVPRETIIDNAMQRCLGVAMFSQKFDGITYEAVDALYKPYWKKFWDLK